jgi:branched-chain amino acid transport system substrate-binding protein
LTWSKPLLVLLVVLVACGGSTATTTTTAAPATTAAPVTTAAPPETTAAPLPEIRILVSAPLTGDYAETGEDLVNGAQLAADWINERGGVSAGPLQGAMLVIESADDEVSTEAAATIASGYVDDPGIWALTGMISSGQVVAAAEVAERENLAVFSTFSCADFLTTDVSNVLVLCTRLQSLGSAALAFSVDQFGADTIAVLHPDFSFYDDINKGIDAQAATSGVTVNKQSFPFDQSDFSALLTNVENEGAQVLGEGDFQANAGRIVSQARAAGLALPIVDFLCEGWSSTFYEVAAEAAAQDVYACESAPRSGGNDVANEAFARWLDLYGETMSSPAIHQFDTILAIEATLAAGADSRDDLVGLFSSISGGDGILGPIRFVDQRPEERPLFFLKANTNPDDAELIAEYRLFADGSVERTQ